MDIPELLNDKPGWLDRRLLVVHHNQFAYSAVVPETLEQWRVRREEVVRQVRFAAGLTPEMPRPELKPAVFGEVLHYGVRIFRVELAAMPGLKLTGSLYLPEKITDGLPGILCPHGHWSRGRVHHEERGSVVMRCLMLAKLGFAVFCYDMAGVNDSDTIPHVLPAAVRRRIALSGAGTFAFQTWNSLYALDFLKSLPEVDTERLGCTGAAGGASQTWFIALLRPEFKAVAPVCMLSEHFQGGCPCEEGAFLRLNGLTNFDILASLAPMPLLLPSVTRDWTVLNPRYEIPALRRVYRLFGADREVENFHCDAPHNYNRNTREYIYSWFLRKLCGREVPVKVPEAAIPPAAPEQLLIHCPPVPATARKCAAQAARAAAFYRSVAFPAEGAPFGEWRKRRRAEIRGLLNFRERAHDIAVRVTCPGAKLTDCEVAGRLISRRGVGDVVAGYMVTPAGTEIRPEVCLLAAPEGNRACFNGGCRAVLLDQLMKLGYRTLVMEMLGSGESAKWPGRSPRDENDPLFFAFNPSLFSFRAADIVTAATLLREDGAESVLLAAPGEASRPALFALTQLGGTVKRAVLDLDGVTDDERQWGRPLNYQPLVLKLGGLRGALLAASGSGCELRLCRPAPELAETAALAVKLDADAGIQITDRSFAETIAEL